MYLTIPHFSAEAPWGDVFYKKPSGRRAFYGLLQILHSVLGGNVAEGHGVAQGQAGGEEGVIAAAEELAAQIAYGVQTLNGGAVLADMELASVSTPAVMEEQRI